MSRSPFADDWHAMQEEQFAHIMRTGNADQRAAALAVMRQAGYDDATIRDLYIQATMHSDEVPPDFAPDMEMIETLRQQQHPNDCLCAHCQSPPSNKSTT